jgi:hypothetical protein
LYLIKIIFRWHKLPEKSAHGFIANLQISGSNEVVMCVYF